MAIPHPDAKGGPPTHLPLLVKYFAEHGGYELKTFYFGSKHFGTEQGEKETLPRKLYVTMAKLLEYLYLLATFRPDIVHINSAFTRLAILRDAPFAAVSRVLGFKSFFKLHGLHSDVVYTRSRVQRALAKSVFWGATRIGVLTVVERNEIVEQFGYGDKLHIVKNIVEPKERTSDRIIDANQDGGVHCLFVSRVEEKKGLQDLINAMPLILSKIPNFALTVAGDGPDRQRCVDLAEKRQVSDRISWLGFVDSDRVKSLYRENDIFVFPTHYPEGMPMALVDALKYGLPIVTTKVRFAETYLEEHKHCVFIEKSDFRDLAEKVIRLLQDEELQAVMENESPKVLSGFDASSVGREFEHLYGEMLDRV